jgi:hypothetical protein
VTLGDKCSRLQAEIDRPAEGLGVSPMTVGMPTRKDDELYVFVDEDGTYHYTYYERGKLRFDKAGGLDDALYWYCSDVVSSLAGFSDRRDRFLFEYQVLSHSNPAWGKRYVRELAAMFREYKPQDLALLPDIGEPL